MTTMLKRRTAALLIAALVLFVGVAAPMATNYSSPFYANTAQLSIGDCIVAGGQADFRVCAQEYENGIILVQEEWNGSQWEWTFPLWSSITDNSGGYGSHWDQTDYGDTNGFAQMQTDGNFVLYDSTPSPIWATNTGNYSGAYFNVQDDGNIVVYTSGASPVWSRY